MRATTLETHHAHYRIYAFLHYLVSINFSVVLCLYIYIYIYNINVYIYIYKKIVICFLKKQQQQHHICAKKLHTVDVDILQVTRSDICY